MSDLEVIARGAWVQAGDILLCRNRRKGNVYLPGGHIEWGEGARAALTREWREETGLAGRVGRFLGTAEHTFKHKGRRVCEINLVFALNVPRWPARKAVLAAEPKLEFFWHPLTRLKAIHLQPWALQQALPAWLRGRGTGWASTYGRGAADSRRLAGR